MTDRKMPDCPLCALGDEPHAIVCHACGNDLHFHDIQIRESEVGSVIIGMCPFCGIANAVERTQDGIGPCSEPPVISEDAGVEDRREWTR